MPIEEGMSDSESDYALTESDMDNVGNNFWISVMIILMTNPN